MFLLFRHFDHQLHFGSHSLTIIRGTSQQVASRNYQIISRYDQLLENWVRHISEDDITDSYYGRHLFLCDDGVFLFTVNDNKVIQPVLVYPDAAALLSSDKEVEHKKQFYESVLAEAFTELDQPHELPTIFEYEKVESAEETSSRLNLLNSSLQDALGRNVYFRKYSTGELFPPSYAKKPFNTFLTLDGYYLGIGENNSGRHSFTQALPKHIPEAAKLHFAAT